MQTGTSGCQYSWLTICLLLLCVFCYQHTQQQNLSFNQTLARAATSQHFNARLMNGEKNYKLQNILIMTPHSSDKQQYHTEKILHNEEALKHDNMQNVCKAIELLPPMLMIMNVQDCNAAADADDKHCFVIVSGLLDEATIQQQQQHCCVQTLTSNSTLFGSVTAALVHLTTWPTTLLLLFLCSINKNNTKTQIVKSNVTCNEK